VLYKYYNENNEYIENAQEVIFQLRMGLLMTFL
jgi:hypothetical protein